jgi:hypothetical protein
MTTLPTVAGPQFAAPSAALAQRVDLQRGFLLEDEVMFTAPSTAETPANSFADGRRAFKEGVCWGATLVPQKFPAQAGTTAVLSVAVLRKDGLAESIPLTTLAGGLYRMTTTNEAVMKRVLRSCSYVLVPATDPAKGPRWFRVTASWRPPADPITKLRQNDGCYVVFDDPGFASFAGTNPSVVGFENVVRVDHYNVILQ